VRQKVQRPRENIAKAKVVIHDPNGNVIRLAGCKPFWNVKHEAGFSAHLLVAEPMENLDDVRSFNRSRLKARDLGTVRDKDNSSHASAVDRPPR